MLLKIQFENEIPIYEQLRNQIILGIAKGELKEGESLPSVRQLAADLGINLHTVNKTYNHLKIEGFLIVHRRKSVIVNSKESMELIQIHSKLEEKLTPLIAESICCGMSSDQFQQITQKIHLNIIKNKESK